MNYANLYMFVKEYTHIIFFNLFFQEKKNRVKGLNMKYKLNVFDTGDNCTEFNANMRKILSFPVIF